MIQLVLRIRMQVAYPEINLLPWKVLLNLEARLLTAPAASLAASDAPAPPKLRLSLLQLFT